MQWPGQKSGWPADMTTGDFTSDQFKKRVVALIQEAWCRPGITIRVLLMLKWVLLENGAKWNGQIQKMKLKAAIAAQFIASFQNKLGYDSMAKHL